jgi:MFS family permease
MRGVTISILAERPTPRRHAAAHAHADSAAAAAAAAMAVPRAGACRCLGPAAARAAPSSGFGVRSSSRPWLLERLSRARERLMSAASCVQRAGRAAAPAVAGWLAGWLAAPRCWHTGPHRWQQLRVAAAAAVAAAHPSVATQPLA